MDLLLQAAAQEGIRSPSHYNPYTNSKPNPNPNTIIPSPNPTSYREPTHKPRVTPRPDETKTDAAKDKDKDKRKTRNTAKTIGKRVFGRASRTSPNFLLSRRHSW